MSQSQKAVLITGALGGIGQALCAEFRQAGYFVIGTDLKTGNSHCDAFITSNVRELCHNPEMLDEFHDAVVREVKSNEKHLTAIINNAATQLLNKTEDITVGQWNETLEVNLVAPFLLIQSFLNELQSNSGCAVNIASVHAAVTKPEFVCYATSKSALVGMTKAMAVDLGAKIRVNAISPAAVATPMLLDGFEGRLEEFKKLSSMHPAGRIAEPVEVAKAAVFLCSEAASFMTGSCLSIDGGISGRLHDPI